MPPSPKTGLRSSTRRIPARNQKALGEKNPESSKPATRTLRRTRKTKQEDDQENEDHNTELIENPTGEAIPKTPATRNGRRKGINYSLSRHNKMKMRYKVSLFLKFVVQGDRQDCDRKRQSRSEDGKKN
ncbi:hypothetical protein Syun_028131 [Stephania yunnanensis]|uniref:Uncharacterized protein n=1 Tax=Stephania yunnanensis TaxID=152371 RepID=A0AAP0EGT2_9MAGN